MMDTTQKQQTIPPPSNKHQGKKRKSSVKACTQISDLHSSSIAFSPANLWAATEGSSANGTSGASKPGTSSAPNDSHPTHDLVDPSSPHPPLNSTTPSRGTGADKT